MAPSDNVRELMTRAGDLSQDWPLTEVQFSLRTGWARDYSDLFAGTYSETIDENRILDSVLAKGRALLCGRGGDGKTWLLRRLYRKAHKQGILPVLIDLRQWTGADYDKWKEWTSKEIGDAADFLVRSFGQLRVGAAEIDRLPPGVRKILFVDGLNEITSTVGSQILQLLDEMVREQINLSVLVVDRLIRRDLPNAPRWSLGMVLPLTDAQVRQHLGRAADPGFGDILSSPFFLDAAMRYGLGATRRAEASEEFLLVHGGLKPNDLDPVAAAAYDAYRSSRSRVFDRSQFLQIAGVEPVAAMERSQTLVSTGDGKCYFRHHLIHDFLAARHFAQWPTENWTPQCLSELTFEASSFDAVEMVFEQLPAERADPFLRQLYDWNLYAAGYALAQAREADAIVGTEMRTMIFAMLAEKRFDRVLATRQKANDALSLMQLSDARQFREARSIDGLFEALTAIESAETWFNTWRGIFCLTAQSALGNETLSAIRAADSIVGWTVANVARRTILEVGTSGILASWLADEQNSTVRWRIAHVLGAVPDAVAAEKLFELLDSDPDGSVRYGAIRSIVELASRAEGELRKAVGDGIGGRASAISNQHKIAAELRSSLLLDPEVTSVDWLPFVAKVVRALFLSVESTADRDVWRRCLAEAERLYDSGEKPSAQEAARG
ncbi:HEAT repeat domain-containing protein [Mesorhizobium sp. B2-4-6]|uniref:HEAT repeat domain-containing protein n=1 Tax=Mesorhizobium sp. B2-4-6 TaxID=2589943 RepID=UPI00112EA63C|nr:HEAT repeat domain-containing protein [Mesorhizobium sp. B2-4-6]TPL38883.1 HEAT repeat domain-containing protein [Mesorhizobium sp. B2-4-6]